VRRWAALAGLGLAAAAWAQEPTLGEIAREARRKRDASTRRVFTNEDLRGGLPPLPLLRHTENPPSLGNFAATPMPVVEAMLELAEVRPGEVVVDLGSGDGRIPILAAEKFGANGVGVEIDPYYVRISREAVAAKQLEDRVRIIQGNALDVDYRPADVITLYLPAQAMDMVRRHLEQTLRPGTRVVSYDSEVPGWKPLVVRRMLFGTERVIYLYRSP
jgi:SAM-dependent methyltransferase